MNELSVNLGASRHDHGDAHDVDGHCDAAANRPIAPRLESARRKYCAIGGLRRPARQVKDGQARTSLPGSSEAATKQRETGHAGQQGMSSQMTTLQTQVGNLDYVDANSVATQLNTLTTRSIPPIKSPSNCRNSASRNIFPPDKQSSRCSNLLTTISSTTRRKRYERKRVARWIKCWSCCARRRRRDMARGSWSQIHDDEHVSAMISAVPTNQELIDFS